MTALQGKVAIVGGSSDGIGYAIARRLAGDGADVALVARRAEPLEAAAARIRDETGRRAFTVAADIRKAHDCERIIAEPLAHFGRLDILVNNDGAPPLGELMSFDDAAWDKAWQQNFMSVVRLTRGAVPAMRAAGGGRIATGRLAKVFGPGGGGAVEQDETIAKLEKEIPLGRIGKPDEVAALVALLVSESGGYMTGATLHVDGGRRASLL